MKSNVDDRLILMVSSPYGYKYYNINAFFKHIIIYVAVAVLSGVFFALVVVYSFTTEIRDVEYKYQYVQEEYNKLMNRHIDLNAQIETKKEELN